jgi:hypothetical protein
MALHTAVPDPEVVEVVRGHLAQLVGRPEFRERALARANPLGIALAAPHDVYVLGLDELAAGTRLADARLVAHRFLVLDDSAALASAEVAADDHGGFMVTEGPYVEGTVRAIEGAEARTDATDAEVRLLRIPALYLVALWLHEPDGEGDLLVPVDPAPRPLEAGRYYSSDELLSELARMARRRADGPDDAGG